MGGTITRSGALLLAAAAGTLSVLINAAPALAHNPLTTSDPKDGARVAKAPTTVRLTFLSRVDPGTTTITVTGPATVGTAAAAGKPSYAGNKITVPIRPTAAGVYTVAWNMISDDGDKINGKIRFTLTTPAAPATPTLTEPATPSAAPTTPLGSAAVVTPTATIDPSNAAGDSASPSGTNWLGWLLVIILAAVALALAALLISRRTRSRP